MADTQPLVTAGAPATSPRHVLKPAIYNFLRFGSGSPGELQFGRWLLGFKLENATALGEELPHFPGSVMM